MKNTTLLLRPAIAMIELIFALVIMGITLMSAPMVLQQSIASTTTGMQQESIAAAAAQINLLMTYPWDESNVDEGRILNTNTAINALQTAQRQASIVAAGLTRQYPAAAIPNATAIGNEEANMEANFDDVDDFNGINSALAVYAGENATFAMNEGDYMDTQVNMLSTISYVPETNGGAGLVPTNYAANVINLNNIFRNIVANSTNIKLINVTLTSTRVGVQEVSNKSVSLSAFVCNIGSVPAGAPIRVN